MEITFRVITPARTVFDGPVEEVVLPSSNGPVSLKPGDPLTLLPLDTGVIRIRRVGGQRWEFLTVLGGFCELEDLELIALVNDSERGDTINVEEAREALAEAEKLVKQVSAADRQAAFAADRALKRARARFEAASGSV